MSGFVLRVGGLHTIDADLPAFRPTHLLGILDPAMPEPAAYGHDAAGRDALVLRFRDSQIVQPEGPTRDHVESILAFVERVDAASRLRPGRLFIHCHAGASRSTAAAYMTLVHRQGPDAAESAFAELLRLTNKPWPNRDMVQLADTILGAGGRLLEPLDAYRATHPDRLKAYLRLHQARARRDAAYGERVGMAGWGIRPRS